MKSLSKGFWCRLIKMSWILLVITKFSVGYNIESELCGVVQPKKATHIGRILGGRTVPGTGRWPWQILILKKGEQHCGGSLISKDWIMTAAHCIKKSVTHHKFYVGARHATGNGHRVRAHLYICHPDSASPELVTKTFEHDICLVKLTESVDFNHAFPVCMPAYGSTIGEGEKVTVTGYGWTEDSELSNVLRQAEVLILNRTECSTWYQENPNYGRPIPDGHFCAGYPEGKIDTCDGDSGGPLVHKETESGITAYVLRGMTSFGDVCAVAKKPGLYVNVAYYMNWIDQTMEQASGNLCQPVLSSECGGYVNESRTIRTPSALPNYAYPSNTTCSWIILAPAGSWIKFKFACYFLLSPERNIKDCGDFATIESAAGPKKFCGNILPDPYLVKSSSATLTFSSNSNLEYPGFVVEVEFTEQTTEAVASTYQPESTTTQATITRPKIRNIVIPPAIQASLPPSAQSTVHTTSALTLYVVVAASAAAFVVIVIVVAVTIYLVRKSHQKRENSTDM